MAVDGTAALVTVMRAADPLATFGVAADERGAAKLWPLIARPGVAQPSAVPWLAASLEVGVAVHPGDLGWLGDFERCWAWCWLNNVGGASRWPRPGTGPRPAPFWRATRPGAATSERLDFMADTRAGRIYSVPAAHPDGLPTPRIMELSGIAGPRGRALTRCADVLRESERKGHVRRIGLVPGKRERWSATVWQLAPGTSREAFIPRQQRAREEAVAAREEHEAALEDARDAGYGPGTPYELQVMVCAALRVAGCTNGEIARLFGVTHQAVSKRLTHPDAAMWTALFSLVSFEVLCQRQGQAMTAGRLPSPLVN